MMNIFVAGGSGFIGTNLIKQLKILDLGDHAVCNFDICDNPINNACNLERVMFSMSNIDIVYHLANIPACRLSMGNPHEIIQNNYNTTLNIAEACRRSDRKIVFLSSFSVYGKQLPPWDEETPVKATTPYGLCKIQSEMLLYAYHEWYGLDVIIIRPSNVFGPHEDLHKPLQVLSLWFDATKNNRPLVVAGKETVRDFTFVGDVVNGIINASKLNGFRTYNLCSGRPMRLLDLAQSISDNIKIVDLPEHETKIWFGSFKKAENDFGFHPTKTVEEWINERKQAMS